MEASGGKTPSTVVVTQPVKNASTPALSSRSTVVQSRHPIGPDLRRYDTAGSSRTARLLRWNDTKRGMSREWYGSPNRRPNDECMCHPKASNQVSSGTGSPALKSRLTGTRCTRCARRLDPQVRPHPGLEFCGELSECGDAGELRVGEPGEIPQQRERLHVVPDVLGDPRAVRLAVVENTQSNGVLRGRTQDSGVCPLTQMGQFHALTAGEAGGVAACCLLDQGLGERGVSGDQEATRQRAQVGGRDGGRVRHRWPARRRPIPAYRPARLPRPSPRRPPASPRGAGRGADGQPSADDRRAGSSS